MLEVTARCFHVVLTRMISARVLKKEIRDNRAGRTAPYGQVREVPNGREESRVQLCLYLNHCYPQILPQQMGVHGILQKWKLSIYFSGPAVWSLLLKSQFFFFFPEAAEMGSRF